MSYCESNAIKVKLLKCSLAINSSLLHELNTQKEILSTREEALSYVFTWIVPSPGMIP